MSGTDVAYRGSARLSTTRDHARDSSSGPARSSAKSKTPALSGSYAMSGTEIAYMGVVPLRCLRYLLGTPRSFAGTWEVLTDGARREVEEDERREREVCLSYHPTRLLCDVRYDIGNHATDSIWDVQDGNRRSCYGFNMECAVRTQAMLVWAWYGVYGTDIGYGGTRREGGRGKLQRL
eukprot:3934780-Rhodomonas_salina.7